MSFEHFQGEIGPVAFFDLIRQNADERIAAAYEADPTLHAFALERGDFLTNNLYEFLEEDGTLQPADERFRSGYAKFAFTFTDPADHTDTLDEILLREETMKLLGSLRESGEDNPDPIALMQGLGLAVDIFGAHLFLLHAAMRANGEQLGATAAERFQAVNLRLTHLIKGPPRSIGNRPWQAEPEY